MLKSMRILSLILLLISLPALAVDEECVASDGSFLNILGCCNGERYEVRPSDPEAVNPYEVYSVCCGGQIVDEFDAKKYKCCPTGKLRGQVVPFNRSCE